MSPNRAPSFCLAGMTDYIVERVGILVIAIGVMVTHPLSTIGYP